MFHVPYAGYVFEILGVREFRTVLIGLPALPGGAVAARRDVAGGPRAQSAGARRAPGHGAPTWAAACRCWRLASPRSRRAQRAGGAPAGHPAARGARRRGRSLAPHVLRSPRRPWSGAPDARGRPAPPERGRSGLRPASPAGAAPASAGVSSRRPSGAWSSGPAAPDAAAPARRSVWLRVVVQPRGPEGWQDSAWRLARLVDAVATYAIFLLDRDGRVATWNAGAGHAPRAGRPTRSSAGLLDVLHARGPGARAARRRPRRRHPPRQPRGGGLARAQGRVAVLGQRRGHARPRRRRDACSASAKITATSPTPSAASRTTLAVRLLGGARTSRSRCRTIGGFTELLVRRHGDEACPPTRANTSATSSRRRSACGA